MYKKLRKSVAEVISTVGNPEQFQWNKWLKEPQIYLERFPKPRIDIKNVEHFGEFTLPSLYQVKKFALTKFKVSEGIKNVVVNKRKTFKVFFFFTKPYNQNITIFDPSTVRLLFQLSILHKNKDLFIRTILDNQETTTNCIPKCISKKIGDFKINVSAHKPDIKKSKPTKHDCLLNKPECSDYKIEFPSPLPANKIFDLNVLKNKTNKKYLALSFNKLEKKPSLKNIPVITLDELKAQLEKSAEKKILFYPVEQLNQKTKQFRVKTTQLDKTNIPIYQLKHLQVKQVKPKPLKFRPLENIDVSSKNLLSGCTTKLKVTDPGILKELNRPKIETVKRKNPKVKFKKEFPAAKPQVIKERKVIKWEDVEADFNHLFAYQKEGMKLLLTNKNSLLCDELGIDKKDQAIHALNTAIKHGVIKNALIVCPNSHIGSHKVGEKIDNSSGWEDQIYRTNPILPIITIRSGKEFENADPPSGNVIYITNYKTLTELSNDSSHEHFNKNIECLILDEAQYLLNGDIQSEQLFNFPESRYRWILSSLPPQIIEERLIPKLANHLVTFEKLDASLYRTKTTLSGDLSSVIRNDFWHDLDLEQSQEYENTLLQGRKRILDLIKGGNPFIIQSNIFTLIHQIKQVGNFSTHKETSPKTELLLDQLESIIASGQKSIIFSQYDKQGIQKIEQLLKNNQIRYVRYQSGMPLKELENSANAFKSESKISVMLAGLTAASVKIKIPEASYLIHFDQWWNPTNQWQYEDKSLHNDNLNQSFESVNVINYFSNNSVELNIRSTLTKKGLLTKNLIEFLPNETIYGLITNEDWLHILGLETPKSRKNQKPDISELNSKLTELSIEEIGQKAKTLFTKLGYKNLTMKPDSEHDKLTIYGIAQKGLSEIKSAVLCLPFTMNEIEPVQSFIKKNSKNNNRLFILCSEEILNNVSKIPQDKIVYIGQKMFANYLSLFNIS